MNTRHLKNALCTSAFLAAGLLATPAFATTYLDVTLSANDPTIIEGNTGSLIFTLANNSGYTITLESGSLGTPTVTGDPTDIPNSPFTETQTCPALTSVGGSHLASGHSCTFTLTFTTPSAVGETDHNSGVTSGTASLTYDIVSPVIIGEGYRASTPYSITVNDPPKSTPEPSSLLLLGTGLLGMVGLRWKQIV